MRVERFAAALVLMGVMSAAHPQSSWDDAAARLRAASLTPEQASAVVERARARGLSPRDTAPWAARAAELGRNGIPPGIMAERLAQGLAKGVPLERIDAALTQMEADLKWLSALLDRITARAERRDSPAQSELALRAGEAALRGGLTRADLARALTPGPLTLEQTITISHAAGSLLAAGVGAAEVVRVLEGAAKAGIGAGRMRNLEQRFVAALADGRSPEAALADFRAGLANSMRDLDPGQPGPIPRDELQQEMRQQMRQEMRDTMRQTLRAPGGAPDVSPGGGAASASAGHSKAGKR
jgi:hypothetical protein